MLWLPETSNETISLLYNFYIDSNSVAGGGHCIGIAAVYFAWSDDSFAQLVHAWGFDCP